MKKKIYPTTYNEEMETTEGKFLITSEVLKLVYPEAATFFLTFHNLLRTPARVSILVGNSYLSPTVETEVEILGGEVRTIPVPSCGGRMVTIVSTGQVALLESHRAVSTQEEDSKAMYPVLSSGARDNRDSSISLSSGSSIILHEEEEYKSARVAIITPNFLSLVIDGVKTRFVGVMNLLLDKEDFNSLFFVADTFTTIRFGVQTTSPDNFQEVGGTPFIWRI